MEVGETEVLPELQVSFQGGHLVFNVSTSILIPVPVVILLHLKVSAKSKHAQFKLDDFMRTNMLHLY